MDGDKLVKLIEGLFDRYGVQPQDPAILGDLADLALTSSDPRKAIDRVLAFEGERSNEPADFGVALAELHDRLTYLQRICSDLADPLEKVAEDLTGPEGLIDAIVGNVSEKMLKLDGSRKGNTDLEN